MRSLSVHLSFGESKARGVGHMPNKCSSHAVNKQYLAFVKHHAHVLLLTNYDLSPKEPYNRTLAGRCAQVICTSAFLRGPPCPGREQQPRPGPACRGGPARPRPPKRRRVRRRSAAAPTCVARGDGGPAGVPPSAGIRLPGGSARRRRQAAAAQVTPACFKVLVARVLQQQFDVVCSAVISLVPLAGLGL